MIVVENCIVTLKEAIDQIQTSESAYFDTIAYVIHVSIPVWRSVSDFKRFEHVDVHVADDTHPLFKVSYYGQIGLLAFQQISPGCILYLRNVRIKAPLNGEMRGIAASDRTASQVVVDSEQEPFIHTQQYPKVSSRITVLQAWAKKHHPLVSLRRRDSVVQSFSAEYGDLQEIHLRQGLIVTINLHIRQHRKDTNKHDVEGRGAATSLAFPATDTSGKTIILRCYNFHQAQRLRSQLQAYWLAHNNAMWLVQVVNVLVHRVDGAIRNLLATRNTSFYLIGKQSHSCLPVQTDCSSRQLVFVPFSTFLTSFPALNHPTFQLTKCIFKGLYLLNNSGNYILFDAKDEVRSLIRLMHVSSPPIKQKNIHSSLSTDAPLTYLTYDTPPSADSSIPQYVSVYLKLCDVENLSRFAFISADLSRILGNIPAVLAYNYAGEGFDFMAGANSVLCGLRDSMDMACCITVCKATLPSECSSHRSEYIADSISFVTQDIVEVSKPKNKHVHSSVI